MSTYLNISDKIGLQSTPNPSLLNLYGGAAAAYSLRQLDYTYTGPAVTVRRDSDQTTKDIGFVNGELDTASLEAFTTETVVLFNEDFTTDSGWTLGSNTTISGGKINFVGESSYSFEGYSAAPYTKVRVTFEITDYTSGSIRFGNFGGGGSGNNVSAAGTYVQEITLGNGNQNWGFFPGGFTGSVDNFKVEVIECNAFVTTWYDQSGSGNDATQTTSSEQPKIVSLGSTILENGKAALEFNGTSYHFRSSTINVPQPTSYFITYKYDIFSTNNDLSDGVLRQLNDNSTNRPRIFSGTSFTSILSTSNNQELRYSLFNGANSGLAINGGDLDTGDAGTGAIQDMYIGRSNVFYLEGKMQEFIIYPINQNSNRDSIETNINDHYSIY